MGTTLSQIEGVDPVAGGDIRRKLEVLGWDCPLHTDDEYARAYGHPMAVSPATMVRVWAMPSYWRAGQPRIESELMTTPLAGALVPGEGDTLIATGIRTEYLAPVYPGDRISTDAVLRGVTRKQTRVGPGAFLVVENTYSNQHGKAVAIETLTLLRYQQQSGGA